ncbi:hypothetical protein EV383_0282 [Pseudonocardia sediminis]|uniref:Cytochrome c oxidase assembly protein subunit 15 n=1 Tax=Pseudonocardia sediminis TaxID=1397368 RepID=A0A4Q7UP28_PSEST|nr:hypothetical protein [Pseudonocardia sediminis]RZT83477.1 hypothetical protein EV383_0282 [Pseudonocardia sediminis]
MRTAYRVLAYLLAIEVVIQAAAVAYAFFGEAAWIEGGGVLDKAVMESDVIPFPEVAGFIIHGINGQLVVPLLALLLLVVSFFAKIPGGVRWAAIVLLVVVVQVLLGMFGRGLPALGMLHGVNALILFTTAVVAARLASGTRSEGRVRVSERADLG